MNLAPAVEKLAQIPPFDLLPIHALSAVEDHCHLIRLRAGENLRIDRVWIVVEGLVGLNLSRAGGGPVDIRLVAPGEFCGYIGDEHKEYEMTAVVAADTEIVTIPPRFFVGFLDHAAFARRIVSLQAAELCEAQAVRASVWLPPHARLAGILLRLRSKVGDQIPLTRRVLAAVAGMARESAIRAVSPWEEAGWIRTRRGKIEILNPGRLRAIANAFDPKQPGSAAS